MSCFSFLSYFHQGILTSKAAHVFFDTTTRARLAMKDSFDYKNSKDFNANIFCTNRNDLNEDNYVFEMKSVFSADASGVQINSDSPNKIKNENIRKKTVIMLFTDFLFPETTTSKSDEKSFPTQTDKNKNVQSRTDYMKDEADEEKKIETYNKLHENVHFTILD